MGNIVPRIDSEIEKRSLLKHSFYKMWSEGKLTIDHLQGYSKEYFQLVKIVPKFVESISKTTTGNSDIITSNAREEAEHVELWARFATALGVSMNDLISYGGSEKTNEAVAKLMGLADLTFEEAVASNVRLRNGASKDKQEQDRWTEKVVRYRQRGRNKIL